MDLLKRENWWIWLIIYLFGQGVGIYILAALLKVYDKNAWYAKWEYWLVGVLCCFFPALIMFSVFSIQITVETAKKLDVAGSEIYGSAYIWILGLIIPIIGWIALGVMSLYLTINTLIALYRGNAEQYID
ncbi:MAG: hypothetical protein HFG15_00005 [Bacilli bacterium]|nr:hypothetical protein [Bacilli bacterium]